MHFSIERWVPMNLKLSVFSLMFVCFALGMASTSFAQENPALESDPESISDPEPEPDAGTLKLGEGYSVSQSPLVLKPGQWEIGLRYGLVGTGPTRFVNDIRVGILPGLELRTALLPYPSSLMVRAQLGRLKDTLGSLWLNTGLEYFDVGFRLDEDPEESQVGVRWHLQATAGWGKAFVNRFAVLTALHFRERITELDDDGQRAVAADIELRYDLQSRIGLVWASGYARTIDSPVREVYVGFTQPGQTYWLHQLDRANDESAATALAMTYGRTESFDVDVFFSYRAWPEPGYLFGSGLRWRF